MTSTSDDDIARFTRVEHWLQIQRPERAMDELRQLSGVAASTAAAYLLWARVLLMQGKAARAAEVLRTSIGAYGAGRAELWLLASALHVCDDYTGAESAILQALSKDPDDADLLATYGSICIHTGQLDKAERLLDLAQRDSPGHADALKLRALLAYARGDDRAAKRAEREYMAADPEDPSGHAVSTFLAANRGEVPRAYASARRVVADDPGSAAATSAARELKAATHWLLWPLRPLMRFGPLPVMAVVFGVFLLMQASGHETVAVAFMVAWVAYVVYSWIAPPLVRWLARRG